MARKRKLPLKEVNTNKLSPNKPSQHDKNQMYSAEIKKIIFRIQKDMTSQQNFIRELRRIYTEMEHDSFMKIITSVLMFAMQQPEDDSNSNTVLLFMCNFLASYKDDENENPCRSVFNFILSTDGVNPHIRFRLCQLVNTLLFSLGEAALDDAICDKILSYMLNRLKNSSPNVRAQAIYALERLQVPEDSDDAVIKYFIYHMQADPSAKVREAVISKIARNVKTIPIIIERLQDSEERVRRHTYIEMMKGFPVKTFRVAQRLTFLENGLTDESKSIRKIVAHLMITEWLVSYNEDYISFLRALKLNGSDDELQRYHKTAQYALREIFKKTKLEKLLGTLQFHPEVKSDDDDEENEEPPPTQLQFCVPIEHITLEHSVFWVNLAQYLYEEKSSDIDLLLPDLTTYCEYLTSYYSFTPNAETSMDEWEELERGYILTNLVSNLKYFDYSDDVGKKNLKDFICRILKDCDLNDYSIKTLLKIMENIVPDTKDRFPILYNIITDLYKPDTFEFVSDRPSMKAILQSEGNSNILLTISELKFNIMDLKEQTANFLSAKEYESAEKVIEELNNYKMAYNKALTPFLKFLPEEEAKSISLSVEKVSSSTILKCLKIVFFMVSSDDVSALTPTISPLYSDFIRRYTESNTLNIRKWALKCGTTFAILYEQFSQDMFLQLRKQFLLNVCSQIWKVSIRAIFQLLVRYDLKHFDIVDRNKSRNSTSKSARQLYRGNDYLSQDDDDDSVAGSSYVNLLSLMSHILDTCTDTGITNTVIEGFCLICLNATCSYAEIISKLMIKYFDPATDSKANQLLGVFFKALIARGKSLLLETALLPTINEILDAGYESTLGEVKPENVIRFVINATSPKYSPDGLNIHESIAESFLKEIRENLNTKLQLVKVLSSELVRLHLNEKCEIKSNLLKIIDEIFVDYKGEEKIRKNLINFQKLLNGELTLKSLAEITTNQTDGQLTEVDGCGTEKERPSASIGNPAENHISEDDEEDDDDNEEEIENDVEVENDVNAPTLRRSPSPPTYVKEPVLLEAPIEPQVSKVSSTTSDEGTPDKTKMPVKRNLRRSLNPVKILPSPNNTESIPTSQVTPSRRYVSRRPEIIQETPPPSSSSRKTRRQNRSSGVDLNSSSSPNSTTSMPIPAKRSKAKDTDSSSSSDGSRRSSRIAEGGSPKKVIPDFIYTTVGKRKRSPDETNLKNTIPNPYIQVKKITSRHSNSSRNDLSNIEVRNLRSIPNGVMSVDRKRRPTENNVIQTKRPIPSSNVTPTVVERRNRSSANNEVKKLNLISSGIMSVDRKRRPTNQNEEPKTRLVPSGIESPPPVRKNRSLGNGEERKTKHTPSAITSVDGKIRPTTRLIAQQAIVRTRSKSKSNIKGS